MKSDVAAKEMLQIARNLCGKKERKVYVREVIQRERKKVWGGAW